MTLVSSPPGGPECGATDRLDVMTVARGRFIARVLPRENYSAWAIVDHGDGTELVSAVREGVTAGSDVALQLTVHDPSIPVQLIATESSTEFAPVPHRTVAEQDERRVLPAGSRGTVPVMQTPALARVLDSAGRDPVLEGTAAKRPGCCS